MICQGTDGISRGDLLEGVMKGDSMLSHIPLHLSACQRNKDLLEWVKSWLGADAALLTPEEWLNKGHDLAGGEISKEKLWWPKIESGKWVWAPPPGAADFAIEQLRLARMKRTVSTHIFVCPKLLTPWWRKHLHCAADLVVHFVSTIGKP